MAFELSALRDACDRAVWTLLDADPDLVVVLGAGPTSRTWPDGGRGSLLGYGVPVETSLGAGGEQGLPLSLTIGGWLLGRVGRRAAELACSVGPDAASPLDALPPGRVALLVMGDGTARRSEQAPGYLDDRAAPYDATVAAALASGDPAALRDLDPGLGAELLAAGVPVWRVAGELAATGKYAAELWYDDAPYGVAYLVATWTA